MHLTDYNILYRLRFKPKLGRQIETSNTNIEAAEQSLVNSLLGTATGIANQLNDYYDTKVKPAQDVLLKSIFKITQKAEGSKERQVALEQTGMLDAISRIEGINDSMERSIISMTTLEQRNRDLNDAFGITTLDAQIFADSLIGVYDEIGINQDALKQYAADLNDFTNGFIVSTNSVHKATTAQQAYQTSLFAGQKYLQQNLGITKELAVKFEEYAVGMKTSAIDLAKNMMDGGFISGLADKTGLSQLQIAKNIIEDIAGLASDVRFEFSKSSSNLELAVMKARMLGTSMDKISKAGTAVLDVEQSVGSEIDYQLLTGQRLLVDGDKSFAQEMRLAKLKKDAPRQAELMYQILEKQRDSLQNIPGAMEKFGTLTGQSTEDVATMINNIDRAKELGIDNLLRGPQKDLEDKLKQLKTKAEADLKNAKTEQQLAAASGRLKAIQDFIVDPQQTKQTAHEQLVQKNLGDITTYLKSFVTTYERNSSGRVTQPPGSPRKMLGGTGTDIQLLGRDLIKALRAEAGKEQPAKLQDMKFDFQGAEAKFGAVYLYKDVTSFDEKTGLFKTLKSDVKALTGNVADFSNAMEQLTNTIKIERAKLYSEEGGPAGTTEREKKISEARSSKKARGGILDGPSHSQGGIQTAYGELEGGEAIINKRSTEKFAPLLSSINEAEGGVNFSPTYEKGGIANKLIRDTKSIYNIRNEYDVSNNYNNNYNETNSNLIKNNNTEFNSILNKLDSNINSNLIKNNTEFNSILNKLNSNINSNTNSNINSNLIKNNTEKIESQQQTELRTIENTNNNRNTIITEKLSTDIVNAIKTIQPQTLDIDKLAQSIANAMKSVKIQTTAVVKTDNTFGTSVMNNASRYTS